MHKHSRSRTPTRPKLESLEGKQLLATFTVTGTGDSGPGTLRQAILDADAAPAPTRIVFQIPPPPGPVVSPVVELDPTSELPPLGPGVVIDGTTQAGYSPSTGPVVVLSGSKLTQPPPAGQQVEGLMIPGDYAGVVGLAVVNFPGDQILLTGQHDVILANRLGATTPIQPQRAGLALLGSGQDTIGLPGGLGNAISGNGYGIIVGPGSSLDAIEGNYVDHNVYIGLYSVGGTGNSIGSTAGPATGNAFLGNGLSGVIVADANPPLVAKPQGNLIASNFIAGNGVAGGKIAAVELLSSGGNTIGDASAASGSLPPGANYILDNLGDGLFIGSNPYVASPAPATGNVVKGNLVGGIFRNPTPLNPRPILPFGNHGNAVVLGAGASGNAIGPGNDFSYNGGAAVVDGGTMNVTAGNTVANEGQRLVDFGVAMSVIPATGPYAVGSTVEVDVTVSNQGAGYSGPVFMALDYAGSPGLQWVPENQAEATVTQPVPSKLLFYFPASTHPTGGPLPGGAFVPGGRATVRVKFIATKAGPAYLQADVVSTDSFDANPVDKEQALRLTIQ